MARWLLTRVADKGPTACERRHLRRQLEAAEDDDAARRDELDAVHNSHLRVRGQTG